jgi:hypothetical protein
MTIKSISGGVGVVVNGGTPAYPVIDMKEVSAGLVRYNTDHLEVFDGTAWKPLGWSDCNVDLSTPAMDLLSWVREKMIEEQSKDTTSVLSPEAIDLLTWVKAKRHEEENGVSPITSEMEELFAWVRLKKQEDDILARKRQEEEAQKRKQADLRRMMEEEARKSLLIRQGFTPVPTLVPEPEPEPEVVEEEVIEEVTPEPTKAKPKAKKKKKIEPVVVVIEKPKEIPPEDRMW